jgi:hypothetical protein
MRCVRGEAETAQKGGCDASKTANFILGYLGSHASYATHIHRFSDAVVICRLSQFTGNVGAIKFHKAGGTAV